MNIIDVDINFLGMPVHLGIIQLVRSKIFRKTNISYPLIRIRTCAYQGIRNVSFSKNFENVLNEWSFW